jgi:hypothetical protein
MTQLMLLMGLIMILACFTAKPRPRVSIVEGILLVVGVTMLMCFLL